MNVYNLIILDQSGSMEAIKKETVLSMNETIQTIKSAQRLNPEQQHFITLVTFSDMGMEGVHVLFDRKPASEVQELPESDYNPCGGTPLFDAMGYGITSLDKLVGRQDHVLVNIITDGMENTSRVYNSRMINELVTAQRAKGWTFAYIGANQDAVEVAHEMNIQNAMNFVASCEGTKFMSKKLKKSREKYYNSLCGGMSFDASDFFDEEEK